jgi:hypothetical protein
LPPIDLDRSFLEIWDDEQLLFPDSIPQVDDALFPDAVPTPDDMPSPGAVPAAADGGADTAAEPLGWTVPIARDSLPAVRAVEPSEQLASNSWNARDDSGPQNANGVRRFSPLREVTPYFFAMVTAPNWMRDSLKDARAIWERRSKLELSQTPERAWPPK